MSTVKAGVGTQFQLGNMASPQVYAACAKIISISGPNISAEQVEVTTLDSTGGYKEFIPGLRDGGECQLELYWIKSNTQQVSLRNRVNDDNAYRYRIVWPDSPQTKVTFDGVVTAFSMSTAANEGIKASITIKISGQVTWS